MIKRGDIAVCGVGCAGLITADAPMQIKYSDGNTGQAWTGIHLQNWPDKGIKIGDRWSSRNPLVVSSIESLLVAAAVEESRTICT